MLAGLLSSAALVAVYQRRRETDEAFALWALVLGLVGAAGSMLHGRYDLANAINSPEVIPANLANLPSQIDPRGHGTFGLAGIGLFVFAWLMGRGSGFPRGLGYLGYLLSVLLVVVFLGRLTVLQATNPLLLIPALLTAFVVNPVWYFWLGIALRRSR